MKVCAVTGLRSAETAHGRAIVNADRDSDAGRGVSSGSAADTSTNKCIRYELKREW